MIYGYARVSTTDQNLDRQFVATNAYKPVDRMFADKQTGKNFDRKQYNELKSIVTKGDEIIIEELDRLGRNKDGIKDEIKWFKERGVILRILDVPTTLIDFKGQDWIADMINNILFEVLGAVAQNEREKIHKRQAEGIAIARANGKHLGRVKTVSIPQELKDRVAKGEISIAKACKEIGVCRSTWYNEVTK